MVLCSKITTYTPIDEGFYGLSESFTGMCRKIPGLALFPMSCPSGLISYTLLMQRIIPIFLLQNIAPHTTIDGEFPTPSESASRACQMSLRYSLCPNFYVHIRAMHMHMHTRSPHRPFQPSCHREDLQGRTVIVNNDESRQRYTDDPSRNKMAEMRGCRRPTLSDRGAWHDLS